MQGEGEYTAAQRKHPTVPGPTKQYSLPLPVGKWPSSNTKTIWSQFDANVNKILEITAKREVDKGLETMRAIIVRYTNERFGHVEDVNVKST